MSSEAERRAKAMFEAEWDLEDDQDLTQENEEKHLEQTATLSKEIKRARRDTIMRARESAGIQIDDLEDEEAAEKAKAAVFPNGFQEIPLAGGGFYRGYIKGGAFHGLGELKFSNGDVYEGSFKKDVRHGYGKFISKVQTITRASPAPSSVAGGKKKGASSSTTTGGGEKSNFTVIRYEGAWLDDRREGGWGIATYSNGDRYDGPFYANRPDTRLSLNITNLKKDAESNKASSSSSTTGAENASAETIKAILDPKSPFFIIPFGEEATPPFSSSASPPPTISDADLRHYIEFEEFPKSHAYYRDSKQMALEAAKNAVTTTTSTCSNKAAPSSPAAVALPPSLVIPTAGKLPTYRFADGRVYVGQLVQCGREGRGILKARNGDLLIGTFSNGVLHGKKCEVRYAAGGEASSSTSEGAAKKKKPAEGGATEGPPSKEPAGKMKKFTGSFRYGRRYHGEIIYTDGKVYRGFWDAKSEKPHGHGTCKLRSGDIYVGEWRFGKMHGAGRISYTGANEGKVYDGEWVADKPHGRGTMLTPTGLMVTCLWDKGKQVQPSDQEGKIAEWQSELEARWKEYTKLLQSAGTNNGDEAAASFAEANWLLDPAELTAAVSKWKMPLVRKTSCTAADLPAMEWFIKDCDFDKGSSSVSSSSSGAKKQPQLSSSSPSAVAEASKKKAVVVVEEAVAAPKVSKKDDDIDSDIDLSDDDDDDDDGDGEIDFDAIDAALAGKTAKKDSEGEIDFDDLLNDNKKKNVKSIGVDDDGWEHFSEVQQPAEESGPSDCEHNQFLLALRSKGFVAELLGDINEFDVEEEEANEARQQKEKEEAIAKAKDTSWFSQDPPPKQQQQQQQQQQKAPAATAPSSTKPYASLSIMINNDAQNHPQESLSFAPSPITKKPPPQSSNGPSAALNDGGASPSSANNDSKNDDFNLTDNDCIQGAQTLMKGWLSKFSIGKSFFGKLGGGGWKTRYFTLLLLGQPAGSAKRSGNTASGLLLYYEDEACNKHLGSVPITSTPSPIVSSESILYTAPTKILHKKADRPDIDIVIEYNEDASNRYKLLLRASSPQEHDQWVMQLSKIIKNRQ